MEFRGFIDKVVCNQENESCMLGKYTSCPTIATLKPTEINRSIKWWQWASNDNGKVEKQQFNGTIDDCFKKLETKCSHFLRHTFIKRMQSCAFKKEGESVVKCKLTLLKTLLQKHRMLFNLLIGFQAVHIIYCLCMGIKWMPFLCYSLRLSTA